MPLVKCPDCGKMVSDRAPSCINCGAPIPSSPLPAPSAATTMVNDERKGRIAELIGGGFCVIAGFLTIGAFNTHTPLLLHDYRSGPLLTAQTFLTYFIGDLVSLTIGFIFHLVTITAGVIAIVRSQKTRGRAITIAGVLFLIVSLIAQGRSTSPTVLRSDNQNQLSTATQGYKKPDSTSPATNSPVSTIVVPEKMQEMTIRPDRKMSKQKAPNVVRDQGPAVPSATPPSAPPTSLVAKEQLVFSQTEPLSAVRAAAPQPSASQVEGNEFTEPTHASAQVSLGMKYNQGDGVPLDYAEAAKWYRKAVAQGSAEGQGLLGRLYLDGQGVPQDYSEAIRLINMSANQGQRGAQYLLGMMYEEGVGVSTDRAEAVRYYRMAAVQGHQEAKAALVRVSARQ